MSVGIGDYVEVFTLPGDYFDPAPHRLQPGDRFVIVEIKGPFVTDGKATLEHGRRYVSKDRVRKIPGPDDQLFTKWFNETILPYSTVEPLEETMRRVHPSLGEINRHGS